MQGESLGHPVGLIFVLEIEVTGRLVRRRVVPPLLFISVFLSPLLLFLFHPVTVGAANVAQVLVVLDVRLAKEYENE